MARIGRWADTRSDAQQRVAGLMPILAPVLIAGFIGIRLLLWRALGEPWSSLLALLVTVGPLATLYRFGVDGSPWRRAAAEGTGGGLLVAFIYWWAFLRPAVTPWW